MVPPSSSLCSLVLQLYQMQMFDYVLFGVVNYPFPPILRANLFSVFPWLTESPNITSFIFISQGIPSNLNSYQKKPTWYFFSTGSMKMLKLMLFLVINSIAFSQQFFNFQNPFALSMRKETISTAMSLVIMIGLSFSSPNTNWFNRVNLSLLKSFVEKLRAIPVSCLNENGTLKENFFEKCFSGTEKIPDIPPVYFDFLSYSSSDSSPFLFNEIYKLFILHLERPGIAIVSM